eukprot:929900-Amphidinium_carterae.1
MSMAMKILQREAATIQVLWMPIFPSLMLGKMFLMWLCPLATEIQALSALCWLTTPSSAGVRVLSRASDMVTSSHVAPRLARWGMRSRTSI